MQGQPMAKKKNTVYGGKKTNKVCILLLVTVLSCSRHLCWLGYVAKENLTVSKVTWQLSPEILSVFIKLLQMLFGNCQ